MRRFQGWLVWGLALGLALALPGTVWKGAAPPPFPWDALGPVALTLALLLLLALGLVGWLGPRLAESRALAMMEAPPELLWGGLLLGAWPAAWGPPGWVAWAAALSLASLPTDLRWLATALPAEAPFPTAWGRAAVRRTRWGALGTLALRWLGARLPLWLTGGLILERLFGLGALGSDWMARVAARDRAGLALWIAAYALLWALARPREATP